MWLYSTGTAPIGRCDVAEHVNIFIKTLTICAMICLFSSLSVNAQELVIYTENSPLLNFEDKDGKITGSSVDIVEEILKRIDSKDKIEMYPWVRAYSDVTDPEKTNIVLFSMTFTEKRRDLFKWVGPIAQNSWQLFAKADSNIEIGNLDDAKKVESIGTYKADVREEFLKAEGFTNLDSTTNNVQNLHKLLSGRISLWMSSDAGASQTTYNEDIAYDQIKPVHTIKTNGLYIAFHKNTPDAIVEKWRQAYGEIKKDGTMERILNKWNASMPTHVIPPPQ
jgi:polar amino acid transport system substrate-binding protein